MGTKLCVLARNANTYFIKRLFEELPGEVDLLNPWESIQFQGQENILVRTSAVYGGDQDLNFLTSLSSETRIINPLQALKALRTKKTQYALFQQLGIPHLPWLDLQTATVEELEAFMGTPGSWLIKPHRGQGGWGIQVLEKAELLSCFQRQKDLEYLVQPFLKEVREYRCFFTPDWRCTLKREASGVTRNFRQGGEAKICEDLQELTDIVQKIKAVTGIHYGAVDVLETPQGLTVLECNCVPGIEQLEAVSGVNVIRKILTSWT